MIAYEGKEPYVFVSYSHADANTVIPIIRLLKDKMCRIWFDEGLKGGESWNDSIAEHLKDCHVFIAFISQTSVHSKYVFSEINYAIAKNKTVLPIILQSTDIPAGLEMMLSTIQQIDISALSDLKQMTARISEFLPKEVFSTTEMPFLCDFDYKFFTRVEEVERHETATKNPFSIILKQPDGSEKQIFSLQRLGVYDTVYRITAVDRLKDYFFSGNVTGSYQINVKGNFLLEYPLNGPDVEVLLICILRIPRHGEPTVKLVDYHYVNSVSSLTNLDEEDLDVVGEKGVSVQIKNYLESILYK